LDHRDYLGDTIDKIAREKAGILREGVPCFAAAQPDVLALRTLREEAEKIHAPLFVGGRDWTIEETLDGVRFVSGTRVYDLPRPGLLGRHQYENAGLAVAALSVLKSPLPFDAYAKGLRGVEWPARLQLLSGGTARAEVWLDGGHNDSAGEALAAQIRVWRREDGDVRRPFFVVYGMLTTKCPREFLSPFAAEVDELRTVPVPNEALGFEAEALAEEARKVGIGSVKAVGSVEEALRDLAKVEGPTPPRILICGSLYLAGAVLGQIG
jgi:dihydrofolate synthase/folylpolyglutamate synthase